MATYEITKPTKLPVDGGAEGLLPPPRSVETLSKPIHLVVDSTGLKVYGEGEWKIRKHGAEKRRTWRKVHLAADGSP